MMQAAENHRQEQKSLRKVLEAVVTTLCNEPGMTSESMERHIHDLCGAYGAGRPSLYMLRTVLNLATTQGSSDTAARIQRYIDDDEKRVARDKIKRDRRKGRWDVRLWRKAEQDALNALKTPEAKNTNE